MDFTEKQIASREIFRGKVLDLYVDTVTLPDGKEATREVVRHNGAVAVIAVDKDRCVHLVRQYRYAFEELLTEIPAGKLEIGEDPFDAAKRELAEETGAVASYWKDLGCYYGSPAIFSERIRLWYATGLTFADRHLDADEFLDNLRLDLDKAADMACAGEFPDGKTQAGILRVKQMIENGTLPVL